MAHTPGQWRIVSVPVGLGIVGMRGTQGEPVAQLHSAFPDVERDNANLIVAVLDLLAACEKLLLRAYEEVGDAVVCILCGKGEWGCIPINIHHESDCPIGHIETAVAKARGKR